MSLVPKMADTPKQVGSDFLRDLAKRARPFAEKTPARAARIRQGQNAKRLTTCKPGTWPL